VTHIEAYRQLVNIPFGLNDVAAVEQVLDDPILSSLAFVQEGRAYCLGPDTWTNPGAIGVEVLATSVADALTGPASEA
jgi:ABC-type Fe3+-hydroxamate transport system substrate-binding protein